MFLVAQSPLTGITGRAVLEAAIKFTCARAFIFDCVAGNNFAIGGLSVDVGGKRVETWVRIERYSGLKSRATKRGIKFYTLITIDRVYLNVIPSNTMYVTFIEFLSFSRKVRRLGQTRSQGKGNWEEERRDSYSLQNPE